jgi:hypothetical protein
VEPLPAGVHEPSSKLPAPSLSNDTSADGVPGDPMSVSDTVAVHDTWSPTRDESGEHDTVDVVERRNTGGGPDQG